MIEINLLGGTGKKKSKASRSGGGGTKMNFGASFKRLLDGITDKYLVSTFVIVVLGVIVVGGALTLQRKQEADLTAALETDVQDSIHFASVLREKQRAEAKRDTVLRRINVIRAIDEDRYVWPHILDEVSKALPPYTWLTVVNYSGSPAGMQTGPNSATPNQKPPAPAAAAGDTAKKGKKVATVIPRDTVRVRLLGRTVDLQALTRFYKQLESSPFLDDVQLQKSELAIDDKKEVYQFTLDAAFTHPDSAVLKRVPLAISVR